MTSFGWLRGLAVATVTVAMAFALAGCGGSSASADQGAAQPTGAPGGQRMDPAMREKIDQCLQAAGIAVPTPAARPTGAPPTGGARPSGEPGERRGGGGEFADPKVQAALQACGITLPTRGPRPDASATPAPGA